MLNFELQVSINNRNPIVAIYLTAERTTHKEISHF